MDEMEEYIYYNNLYDCYYKLLTEKQKSYFEDYYFSNLSLGEISENYHVSRNAVYKQIQITIKKLMEYEEKLNLFQRRKEMLEIISKSTDKSIKEKLEQYL